MPPILALPSGLHFSPSEGFWRERLEASAPVAVNPPPQGSEEGWSFHEVTGRASKLRWRHVRFCAPHHETASEVRARSPSTSKKPPLAVRGRLVGVRLGSTSGSEEEPPKSALRSSRSRLKSAGHR